MSISADRAEISCTLNDKEFQVRREEIRRLIQSYLLKSEKVDKQLVLTFPERDSVREDLRKLMALEKQCCSFLDFKLDSVDESAFTLTIEGPPEFDLTLRMFTTKDIQASNVKKASKLRRTGIVGIVIGTVACMVCVVPFILVLLGMGGMSAAITILPLKQFEIIGAITMMLGVGIYMLNRMRSSSSNSTCCKSCK